jgi:hypothetical protein
MKGSNKMLATSEDKQRASVKLQNLIQQGQSSARNVIEHIMSSQPTDELPRGRTMQFDSTPATGVRMSYDVRVAGQPYATQKVQRTLHRNALGQMATTIDMPIKFLDSLQETREPWGRELLAHNLGEIFHQRFANKSFLVRSLHGEARGFLSDQYRRIDSRPVVEAFATAVAQKGARAYEGVVTDTKINIKAIYPEVYEAIPGEMIAFGISLENSDYGNGALSIREYIHRIWCTNLAIFEETMRQVHLGKRLDESMVYSERTYQLDSQTTVSALKDVVRLRLDSKSLDERVAALQTANSTEVTPDAARAQLKKLLNKGEAEDAAKAFESADTYNLPEGKTAWRLSNAISWIAGQEGVEPERKLELNKIAA